jgi:hypothetical protein
MVHATISSDITFGTRSRRYAHSSNLYRVVINCEDGEFYEYEVEADSHSQASSIGESLAGNLMDIQYIEVYIID